MIKNTNACQLPFPSSQLKPVSRLLVRAACVLAFCFAPLLVSAQQAPLITPRDLRPETPVKPPMNLPQPASAAIPSNAAVLFVRLGDVAVKGGFPEFAAGTEALLSPLRAQRVCIPAPIAVARLLLLGLRVPPAPALPVAHAPIR